MNFSSVHIALERSLVCAEGRASFCFTMKKGRVARDKRAWEDYEGECTTWVQVVALLTQLAGLHCDSKPLVAQGYFVNAHNGIPVPLRFLQDTRLQMALQGSYSSQCRCSSLQRPASCCPCNCCSRHARTSCRGRLSLKPPRRHTTWRTSSVHIMLHFPIFDSRSPNRIDYIRQTIMIMRKNTHIFTHQHAASPHI